MIWLKKNKENIYRSWRPCGDTSVSQRFTCEDGYALMEPVEYEGVHGITYKIEE